jgi:hypothetical protein
MMRIASLIIILAFSAGSLQAQLKKTLHKTFEVPEQTTTLLLNIYEDDSYEVVPWAGNAIMTETNIKVYYTSRAIFDFLLEQGRYEFITAQRGDSLLLSGQDMQRRIVKVEETESLEKVHSRIFIPDAFQQVALGHWVREVEEPEEGEAPRKTLEREKINVSDALKEAVKPATDTTRQEERQ